MDHSVRVAPLDRFAQLEDVAPRFLGNDAVGLLLQQLQHVLKTNHNATLHMKARTSPSDVTMTHALDVFEDEVELSSASEGFAQVDDVLLLERSKQLEFAKSRSLHVFVV